MTAPSKTAKPKSLRKKNTAAPKVASVKPKKQTVAKPKTATA
jgi:hypothetical protein